MPGAGSWLQTDSEKSPRRRALETVLWTAALTPLLLLNAADAEASASLADLAPAVLAGVAVGIAAAIAIGSTEGGDRAVNQPVATFASLALVLLVSFAVLTRWSTIVAVAFFLATVWTITLGHVGHLLIVPRLAGERG